MKGLVALRCEPTGWHIERQAVMGVAAMGKSIQPKARPALRMTIMFEPSRLSGDHLADAYAQVVAIRPRRIGGAKRISAGPGPISVQPLKGRQC